ncbi:MAG: hypothetical protein DRG66_03245 [Deltaproteobacteria bacterium]|nr:MAG: hypothetical protein DRG66_03245 [Deltaproteobacteria bacterium]
MKKSFLFSTIIILILLTHNVVLGEDFIKIGLIDVQRCLDESKEGQKIINLLKKKKDVLQRQLGMKEKELSRLRDELEKQAMILSMDAQEDKKRTFERKTRDFKYLLRDLNEDMRRARQKEEKTIFSELLEIIEKIGSEENYTLIMQKKAGGVLYCTDLVDITEKVIRAYDQMKEQSKE